MRRVLPSVHLFNFNKFLILLITLDLLVSGCWKRQSVDLLPPETPHYNLSGTVVDVDTHLPVQDVRLVITSVQMVYPVDWTPLTVWPDSSGFYSVDSVFPGNYSVAVFRNDFPVLNLRMTVQHADKVFDMGMPTPVMAELNIPLSDRNPGGDWPVFTMEGGPLWIMGSYSGYIGRTYYSNIDGLMSFNLSGTILDIQRGFMNPSVHAQGLIYAQSHLYAYYSNHVDVIVPTSGVISSTVSLDDPISALAFHNNKYYATWGNTIQNRGADMVANVSQMEIASGSLGAIACSDSLFWVYDKDRKFLLEIGLDGMIRHTFRPFWNQSQIPVEVFDLGLDISGQLWISESSDLGANPDNSRLFKYSSLTF